MDLSAPIPRDGQERGRAMTGREGGIAGRAPEDRLRGLLGRASLFRDIPPGALDPLLGRFSPREIAAGTVVMREGDEADELFLVETGDLDVRAVLGGHDVRLGTLHAGDVFGEVALLRRRPRSATVTALTAARLWALARADVVALVRAVPEIGTRLRDVMRQRELANALRALQ